MSSLTNPLDSILAQAAQLPDSGALKAINKRLMASGDCVVILIDTSFSMLERVNGEAKITLLKNALRRPIASCEVAIAFNSDVSIIPNFDAIPEPGDSTDLAKAITFAATYKPKATLIISDGLPDCEVSALKAASQLTGVINCLFIGDEEDIEAKSFMRKLARLGCGKANVCDISSLDGVPKLKSAISRLLPAS